MFGISDDPAFCIAVLVFLALPGPGTFALLTSTAKGGFRAGAAATAGVILGDQVLLWLAVAGVAAVLAASPVLFRGVQYAGAAYLAWIGVRLLLSRPGAAPPIRIEPRHYLRQIFFITLLNPKAIVFYMAFFPQFVDAGRHDAATFAAMAATIAVLTAAYGLLLCVCAGAVAAKVRAHRSAAAWLERAAGACLLAFGLRLAGA